MKLERLKELAGVEHTKDMLDEAVEIPADVTFEQLESMMDAAKRALGFANKLKDPADKKKHLSKVMSGLNKIRNAVARMLKMGLTEAVDEEQIVETFVVTIGTKVPLTKSEHNDVALGIKDYLTEVLKSTGLTSEDSDANDKLGFGVKVK